MALSIFTSTMIFDTTLYRCDNCKRYNQQALTENYLLIECSKYKKTFDPFSTFVR